MYVEGVGQKSGPCTATFNDLFQRLQKVEGDKKIIMVCLFCNADVVCFL
jgi:hypothetical protein